ncbi:hypothetical protein RJT34_23275 [Clitoria ternatea]|uniref:Uncharacterized protein n=1 Tax=Clitoria ternatea TaxID=43366 RepID=A0AAN9FKT8_CLITE
MWLTTQKQLSVCLVLLLNGVKLTERRWFLRPVHLALQLLCSVTSTAFNSCLGVCTTPFGRRQVWAPWTKPSLAKSPPCPRLRVKKRAKKEGSHAESQRNCAARELGTSTVTALERELETEMNTKDQSIGLARFRHKCGEGKSVVEMLECLEMEAIMGDDVGKEPVDYNRRA